MEKGFNRRELLGTFVDNLSMSETIEIVNNAILKKQQIIYSDLNADKVVSLQKEGIIKDFFNTSTIINADGQSVIWAAKLLGKPLKERVTGVDLMNKLVEQASINNYKVFFLGAKENVVKTLVEKYSSLYGKEIIAGYRNGYFTPQEEEEICNKICESQANILFVGITSPKKEEFLYKNLNRLQQVNFLMGVGGSFDVHAGYVKRAPVFMQKMGLEWFYRFLQEPKRMWKRYLISNSKFLAVFLKHCFKN